MCPHNEEDKAKLYDDFAVGIYLHGDSKCYKKLFGHLPIKLSFLLHTFLEQECCSLTFSQVRQSGGHEGGSAPCPLPGGAGGQMCPF